nr:MAG TPA: hypothetical protein [Caudoviricetes sp.]
MLLQIHLIRVLYHEKTDLSIHFIKKNKKYFI